MIEKQEIKEILNDLTIGPDDQTDKIHSLITRKEWSIQFQWGMLCMFLFVVCIGIFCVWDNMERKPHPLAKNEVIVTTEQLDSLRLEHCDSTFLNVLFRISNAPTDSSCRDGIIQYLNDLKLWEQHAQ